VTGSEPGRFSAKWPGFGLFSYTFQRGNPMALSYEFLMARADEAAREAETALLDNVRLRALRSEAVWRDMAERAQKIEEDREKARIEKQSKPPGTWPASLGRKSDNDS